MMNNQENLPASSDVHRNPKETHTHEPPTFVWSHLYRPAIVNPVNLKSYTIPIFNLADPYARSFHLSWLGFFVAFLSWFAFPPLLPEAIKADLKLTNAQVANSNVVALVATLIIRFFVGPIVDRYGPRKVMASILIIGAIPTGLAGTAHDATTLYVFRFFIGILGATFVPCQAWTSAFFDKNCVGTANALVGGWGNMGGGATFAVMVSLYEGLRAAGLTQHVAWRASFVIIPAPVLILVAVLTLVFGQDHPAGKWSERHNILATTPAIKQGHHVRYENSGPDEKKSSGNHDVEVTVQPAEEFDADRTAMSTVDVAINETLTVKTTFTILSSPLTWLPAFAYLTTFGLELLIDAKMADVLFSLFTNKIVGFDQKMAGFYTSIFGFMNVVTRPLGGYLADVIYRKFGIRGKKYLTLSCGMLMGVTALGGGVYLAENAPPKAAQLPTLMGIFAVSVIFSEIGNGANFALVPHCNPYNNGVMSGLVGAFGNLGGIIFTLIFRFQTAQGKAFWIVGLVCIILNALMVFIPVPRL